MYTYPVIYLSDLIPIQLYVYTRFKQINYKYIYKHL